MDPRAEATVLMRSLSGDTGLPLRQSQNLDWNRIEQIEFELIRFNNYQIDAFLARGGDCMGQETEVEKAYSNKEVVAKLRRLADSLEQGKTFEIQIAGNRIYIPADATVEFEYAREGDEEEVEIELKWQRT